MKINLGQFGEMLVSRPAGREAYLSAKAYILKDAPKSLEVDFTGVKVLTPSWLGEFVGQLKVDFPKTKVIFLKSDNPSVKASLLVLS